MKNPNILITGFGSAGKRHFQNLLQLGYSNIAIVSRKKNTDTALNNFSFYTTMEEACKHENFNAAFICTPTSLHIQNLKELLHYKTEAIYIEKPVSNSYDEVDEVTELASSYKNNIVVGYDLHFDPGVLKLKELLRQNSIGKIIVVNVMVGQHLSQWRPYEDYRKGMSAKKETGGGVLSDLAHEFDYLQWLLGDVQTVACNFVEGDAIEIETEMVAQALLKFANGIIATVHLDYLQPCIIRNAVFTGTAGTITLDLAAQSVSCIKEDGSRTEFFYKEFSRNDRFISIIKTFLENPGDERLTSLRAGLKSLCTVLAAKQSCVQQCFVNTDAVHA